MFPRFVAPLVSLSIAAAAQVAPYDTTIQHVEALDEAAMRREGVHLAVNPSDAHACVLEWRDNKLPLPVAANRVAVGRLGPDRLAVLAAGVREALVVYVVESGGAIARLATEDGLRLPPKFNDEGSWPVAIGREVFVVAYEKDLRVELRAFGFGDKVFAARTLPAEVAGYAVRVDQRLQRIGIVPTGVAGVAPLEFTHPLAPRIEFADPVLDFGAVAIDGSRRVRARLRNLTADAIDVFVRVQGEFRLDTAQVRVGPAATAEVVVEFVPGSAREQRGQLFADHAGLERPLVLPLRGTGVRPAAVVDAGLEGARTEAPSPTTAPAVWTPPRARDAGEPGPVVMAPEVRVARPAPSLARSPSPTVRQEGSQLVVRGRPGELVLLAAVTVRTDGARTQPDLPLAIWRLRLSATDGVQRLSLRSLELRPGQGLVALRRTGGEVVDSAVFRPDFLALGQSGN